MQEIEWTPSDWAARPFEKVEFARLSDFITEVREAGGRTVRVDIFEETRLSELSFVYYVSFVLYVSAQPPATHSLYEFKEPVGTVVQSTSTVQVKPVAEFAAGRLQDVEQELRGANFTIRRGRYTLPDQFESDLS